MSLSENLHNLGTLMKTNLEKQWVTGLTGDEGLTTLANKILDISSQKGITLQLNTLDSKGNIISPIVQKDEDYSIQVTLLNNNRPIVGQPIRLNYYYPSFKDDPYLSWGEYDNGTQYMTDRNGGNIWELINGQGEGYALFTAVTTIDGKLFKKKYKVIDCIARNRETSTSDFWTYWSSTSNSANAINVYDSGTVISTDSTKYTATFMQIWLKDASAKFDVPLCIELDVIESTNFSLTFHCKQSDGTTSYNSAVLAAGRWKISITANKLEVYKNNVLQWSKSSLNNTQVSTFFQSARSNGNGTIKFNNYLIYPMEI